MQGQSWTATLLFALIAFGGGYLAGMRDLPRRLEGGVADAAAPDESVYFSPDGGCTDRIVREIGRARRTIELQSDILTSVPIADALLAASRRGVNVTLVLDAARTGEHREQAARLALQRVPVWLDARHAVARSAILLIDDRTVICGSFDFTPAAEHENAEDLVILRDRPRLQSTCEENFQTHMRHSRRYDGT